MRSKGGIVVGASQAEWDLVQRMRSGDESAFDEFFAGYFPALYRFALARLRRDEDTAEEVAQAALCLVVRKLETYRGEAPLFSWMCTFCRHEISAWYRRRGREPRESDLLEDDPGVRAMLDSLAMGAEGPDDDLQRREVAQLIRSTLDRLPPHYGNALEWKYLDSLPVAEIAGRLNLGLKAAESLLPRARHAFRDGIRSVCQVGELGELGPRR